MRTRKMIASLKSNPRPLRWFLLVVWLFAGGAVLADETKRGEHHTASHVSNVPQSGNALSANSATTPALPPLPEGVAELKFSDFYRQPVGSRGLEFSDKLRSLDGKRVRILGYMVRQEQPVAHCFLLTPLPVKLDEHEYGFAEDMPATVLHVFTDPSTPSEVPFTPGLLLLTGTLSIGNRTEPDGRISSVRLQLDVPPPEKNTAATAADSGANQIPTTPAVSH